MDDSVEIVTLRLHYQREYQPTPEELFKRGQALLEAGSDRARVLFDGESKNPWPQWLQDVLKARNFKYDFFNQDYCKNFRGRNDDESAELARMECKWVVGVARIIDSDSMVARLLRCLWHFRWFTDRKSGRCERPMIWELMWPDPTKKPQMGRVTSYYNVNETQHGVLTDALDTQVEKETF